MKNINDLMELLGAMLYLAVLIAVWNEHYTAGMVMAAAGFICQVYNQIPK